MKVAPTPITPSTTTQGIAWPKVIDAHIEKRHADVFEDSGSTKTLRLLKKLNSQIDWVNSRSDILKKLSTLKKYIDGLYMATLLLAIIKIQKAYKHGGITNRIDAFVYLKNICNHYKTRHSRQALIYSKCLALAQTAIQQHFTFSNQLPKAPAHAPFLPGRKLDGKKPVSVRDIGSPDKNYKNFVEIQDRHNNRQIVEKSRIKRAWSLQALQYRYWAKNKKPLFNKKTNRPSPHHIKQGGDWQLRHHVFALNSRSKLP